MRHSNTKGFTVIELLLVVVLLFVLAALVALTASGVQAKNRNGDRQADIDALHAQLEGYYAGTDSYPTLTNINDSTWRGKNLPKLKDSSIDDPKWKTGDADCTANDRPALAAEPNAGCYSYQVTSSDGSSCDNDKTPCVHYTLTATLEGGEKYVKSSLN